jgi:hypothetical protein
MTMQPLTRIRPLVFIASVFSTTSCGTALPPDDVDPILEKQFSDRSDKAHFECADGESGWNYICEVRYERTPSARFAKKVIVQRVGVKLMGNYHGTPSFAISPIPEGRPLSAEELTDFAKTQVAEASQKAR